MIKKIWQDPVWSKIISVGILGIASLGYAKFLSITEKLTFKEAFNKMLEIKIPIILVMTIIGMYWIIIWIFKKSFKKSNNYYTKKQEKFREFNRILDPRTGILFRWVVYFNGETPFIDDLTAFCTKHEGAPIRFMSSCCPIRDCPNSKQEINEYVAKNMIESDLIDKWDKI